MDAADSTTITVETMRDIVLNNTIMNSEEINTFRWGSKSKDVVTQLLSRSVRSTVNSETTIDGYETCAFGYEQEESKP